MLGHPYANSVLGANQVNVGHLDANSMLGATQLFWAI